MQPEDILCRSAIYPKFVAEATNVFDAEQMFQPHKVTDREYALSVTSEFCARSEDEVHRLGRISAGVMSSGYQARTGRDPDPAIVYLGFYKFKRRYLCVGRNGPYLVLIRWREEHGNYAHFNIELHEVERVSKSNRIRARREIVLSMSDNCFGPFLMDAENYSPEELSLVSGLTRAEVA